MKPKKKAKLKLLISLALTTTILVILSIIPLKLAIAFERAPNPQAILTLGGGPEREEFTATFAQSHSSDLPIWVSSGIPDSQAWKIFERAEINRERINLHRGAVDTVTNFTSLVADFKQENIRHLYLITSDFHMPRAKAIAIVVLGSQGIAFTPVSIPSKRAPESKLKIVRDTGRAIIWLVTRRTGASLNNNYAVLFLNKS